MLDIFPLSYSSVFPLFSLVRAKKIVDAKCSFFKPLYFSEYERVLCVCESRQKSCDPLPHCDDTYIRVDCKNAFDAHVDG